MNITGTQEPRSLKELFQSMVPEAMAILRGKVLSASPLKIQIIGDEKMIIGANIICLPWYLSTHTSRIDIAANNVTQDGQNIATLNISNATMTVYNGLKSGETVYMLSFNHGKKYYILDREA